MLTSVLDPSGVTSTYSYDPVEGLHTKAFSDSTPTASYAYDPDGHLATASNAVASDSYVYNADGTLKSDTEGTVETLRRLTTVTTRTDGESSLR